MNSWIIDKPELQSLTQQLAYGLLTLLLWLFWIYLWLPLFSYWEEPLGIASIIDNHMFTRHEYRLLLDLFVVCGITSLGIAIVMIYWTYHNYIPLTRNKRRRPPAITKVQIADYFRVDAYQLREWHRSRRLDVDHDLDGWVSKVDVQLQGNIDSIDTGNLNKELDIYAYIDPKFRNRRDEE